MLKFITLKKKKLRSRVIGACLDFASATRQASCFWFGWFTASWAWSSVVPAARVHFQQYLLPRWKTNGLW